jgi:hypothetical protein
MRGKRIVRVTKAVAPAVAQTEAGSFRRDDVLRILERSWPPVVIGLAVAVNAVWIGFLGYCIFRLI